MRCAQRRRVPLAVAREAQMAGGAWDADRTVQCQLANHQSGDHYGFLDDTGTYGAARWLRWQRHSEPSMSVLPDCPVVAPGPDGEGCCLFSGHSGEHTWEGSL